MAITFDATIDATPNYYVITQRYSYSQAHSYNKSSKEGS